MEGVYIGANTRGRRKAHRARLFQVLEYTLSRLLKIVIVGCLMGRSHIVLLHEILI